MARRLAKLGDPIMGGVGAFVPEHFGKRPRACIQSDADFGSGAGTAERRPAAGRRLAVTLPLGCERTAYGASGTAAPVGRAGEFGEDRSLACGRDEPVHGRGAAGATVAARLHRADDDGEPVRLRRIERPSTRQTSQPGSSVVIARCTAAGYRCDRRRREAGVSGGSGWSRRTPSGLPWS